MNVDLKCLISGIIAIIDASIQLYEAVDDVSGLPRSFRDVADRLPAILHTLEAALYWLAEEEEDACMLSTDQYIALSTMLKSCRNKAIAIQKVLQSVIPDANASLIMRCAKAIKAISSTNTVDSLMQGILHDLQVLTANRAVNTASRSQIKRYIKGRFEEEARDVCL
ncbi:uncharacterized protein TrAFT101_008062 [Trichoderma asperellum]|uniref:NACHT-NTPase and P-loop NTPases N-terminal domain-containing protein n=1 Tax=Trichoderma asperellum (strain ATCC 204424 / CBS 433.97 / NBRC 101777) TaxID=1042311 RepID=A0A2T3Z2W3_TRIA4|nr:hypothetical protein M441DRAFT_48338 [Trichoderma asperellum CBS 433.97]PTB39144.1 hypothetical protein M441DRAFT_48338 [Trichoderma asperellum CBS 433.97]UKZ93138.1 hypothetical protein TrAFT101_008062 [Trichoderma asperellum]